MPREHRPSARAGLLKARPLPVGAANGDAPGVHVLGLASGRDGLFYVPKRYDADRPAPLIVLFHGAPSRPEGRPRLFMSHGVQNSILPIDACSRRLAPKLKAAGYDLDYREFDGGHLVPPEMATAAVARLN